LQDGGFMRKARGIREDAAAVVVGGRRVQGGVGSARRVSSPIRTTAEARRKLQDSLNADGEAKAVCIGATLDLERLAASINPRSKIPSVTTSAPPPQAPMREEKRLLAETSTEVARKFGTGENLVLQLKLFRDKDLFAFRYGCMVCWDFTGQEYNAIKERFREFAYRPLLDQDAEEESMEFVIKRRIDEEENDDCDAEDNGETGVGAVNHDQIVLSTSEPLERLAHSYALAQSVRLAVFEIVVDRSIAVTRSIPETMATTGEVCLDARELSKQMGNLLMLRCDVNLHTDILDTPDIFWDEERFEPHYVESREYLEIDKRVEILNQRLSVLKDLYDLLQNGLNVKHGNKLEWIIIILILVEVVLELLELLHDAWSK